MNSIGNRGVLEADTSSDPQELVDNGFFAPFVGSALYLDRLLDTPELVDNPLGQPDAVNALIDVPIVRDNTFQLFKLP